MDLFPSAKGLCFVFQSCRGYKVVEYIVFDSEWMETKFPSSSSSLGRRYIAILSLSLSLSLAPHVP